MKYLRIIIPAVLILTIILVGKVYYDTYTIEVRHYRIENNRLAHALDGKKVAFVSDLHTRNYGSLEKEVISILQREKPDYVFLGGDYIAFRASYDPVISFFGQLQKAYAVMGNSDYYNENGSCILCHQPKSRELKADQNVVFLRNTVVHLNHGGNRINLLGVDDPVNKKSDISGAMRKCDRTVPSILLAHSPEVFEEAVRQGIDFVLCGHNHGGQVFLTKYLNGKILIDPALRYLDGFFHKGNTLMYVGRGIGTSFLPFRLGVRPEVTIFQFAAGEGPSENTGSGISYSPVERIFSGFSVANVAGLFDFFSQPDKMKHSVSPSGKLFDFESEAELEYLNWECNKWFEMSEEHATSGRFSLRVTLPPGQYPGINFIDIEKDWSAYRQFKMDVFNTEAEPFTFHVRIDDRKSGWEYADRFDRNFIIKKGMNNISIPFDAMKANMSPRSLDWRNIERLMFFVPANDKKRTFHIDNIRLE